jgi:hypothetical protein
MALEHLRHGREGEHILSVADVLLPELHRRFAAVTPFLDTRRETWALEQAYASLLRHNFSATVLEAGLPALAVSALPPLMWSDLGTPERVLSTLRVLKIAPPRDARTAARAPDRRASRVKRSPNAASTTRLARCAFRLAACEIARRACGIARPRRAASGPPRANR